MATDRVAPCLAPWVTLRFDPGGAILACCANKTHPVGHVGETSIREAWIGARAAALRDALAASDFSQGCADCGSAAATGDRLATPAADFDRWAPVVRSTETVPEHPRRLEFAMSNTCNLMCVHCNGDLSSAIRSRRERRPPLPDPYDEAFFEELAEFLPHVEVAVFIGGEPFLARPLRRVWDMLLEADLRPEVHVTTNGTIWDEKVVRYITELDMQVTISIDGATAEINDEIRRGSSFAEVQSNRDRLRELQTARGRPLAINHCLMLQNWDSLDRFLLDADAHGDLVHLIPVLYPARDSLLCSPADELRSVVAELERRDPGVRSRLRLNLRAWDLALRQLRGHLDALDSGSVPVELRRRERLPLSDIIPRERDALAAWAGDEPLTIRTVSGHVVGVDGDARWAPGVDPHSWVGHPAEATSAALAQLGPLEALEVDESERGLTRTRILSVDGLEIRAVAIDVHEADQTVLVAARHRSAASRVAPRVGGGASPAV